MTQNEQLTLLSRDLYKARVAHGKAARDLCDLQFVIDKARLNLDDHVMKMFGVGDE